MATRSSADCSSTTWMSWTPMPSSVPRLREFGANLHQDLSQHVGAGAVAAVAPVGVVGRVLYDLLRSGIEQDLFQIGVLGELRAHRRAHHVVLDLLPVGAQWTFALAPHAGGPHGRRRAAQRLSVRRAGELHRLEVVLAGRPLALVEGDRVRREVREAAVRVLDPVEADHSPGGWRATKPAVERIWLVQRVPPPDSALVS